MFIKLIDPKFKTLVLNDLGKIINPKLTRQPVNLIYNTALPINNSDALQESLLSGELKKLIDAGIVEVTGTSGENSNSVLGATVYTVGPANQNFPFSSIQTAYDQAVLDGCNHEKPAVILIAPGEYEEDVLLEVPGIYLKALVGSYFFDSTILRGSLTIKLVGGPDINRNTLVSGISILGKVTLGEPLVIQRITLDNCSISDLTGSPLEINLGSGSLFLSHVNVKSNSNGDPVVLANGGNISWVIGECSNLGLGDSIHTAASISMQQVQTSGTIRVFDPGSVVFNFAGLGGSNNGADPCLVTDSSGFSVMAQCTLLTNAEPAVDGSGTFAYVFLLALPGYNVANALSPTLNGGVGGFPFPVVP